VDVNVAAQEQDEHSVLNFYRKAIALRKTLSCVRYGDYKEYDKLSSSLYTYSREDDKQKILVVCSFTEKCVPFKAPKGFDMTCAELVLQNYAYAGDTVQPYEVRVYLWKK
jgi:oligo-1,6-glucosidase